MNTLDERSVFLHLLGMDPAEQKACLDRVCAHDPMLKQKVEALLESHASAGEFLQQPLVQRRPVNSPAPTGETEQLACAAVTPSASSSPAADEAAGTPTAADEDLSFLMPSTRPGCLGMLQHYEIRRLLGKGGFGLVLEAYDERLHRVVAIKALAPRLATSATARIRFMREARAAAAVVHDHVVTIHDVGECNGVPYMVMQCILGISLEDKIKRSGALELKEILRIGMQTAQGLASAHKQGLVHRDIKPGNILLENGVQRVKITDFGLAKVADDATLTQSGVIAGTPSFMAPEQALGQTIDHRADLFSLGSVLYLMCSGRLPFRAENSMAVMKRVVDETPRPIRDVSPELPVWLADVIAKLHAKDPAQRYQSATEVGEVLAQGLAELQGPVTQPAPAVTRTPDPVKTEAAWAANRARIHRPAALAAALLVAAGLGWGMWWSRQPVEPIDEGPDGEEIALKPIAPLQAKTPPAAMFATAEQIAAAEWVLSEQGQVTIRKDGKDVPVNKTPFPPQPFSIVGVSLKRLKEGPGQGKISDEELRQLVPLLQLEALNLTRQPITAAGLAQLTGCTQLRALTLYLCDMGAEGIPVIAQFSHLEKIYPPCGEWKGLASSDDWAAGIASMPTIRSVQFFRSGVSAVGLAHLARLPNLESLELGDCANVKDASLKELAACKKLDTLVLLPRFGQPTDAGLKELAACKNLRTLVLDEKQVNNGKMTLAAIADLQRALPDCQITFERGKAIPLP